MLYLPVQVPGRARVRRRPALRAGRRRGGADRARGVAARDAALRRGAARRGARRVRRGHRPARAHARVPRADRARSRPERGDAQLRARGALAAAGAVGPGRAPRLRVPQRRDRLRHLAGRRHRVRGARAHPRGGLRGGRPWTEPARPAVVPGAETVPADLLAAFERLRGGDHRRTTSTCSTRRSRPAPTRCAATPPACSSGTTRSRPSAARAAASPPRSIERIEHRALGDGCRAPRLGVALRRRGHGACRRSSGSASTARGSSPPPTSRPARSRSTASVWRTVGDPLWQGAWEGPLAGLTVAVKDLFAIKGYRIGAGNPTFLDAARPETTTAPAVSDLLRGGASLRGIARTDEFAYSIAGDNVALRHPAERRAARRAARRLVERAGVRRGHRPGRHRPRDRHRRVGAGARVVPGAVGTAHDARARAAPGPAARSRSPSTPSGGSRATATRCSASRTGASATTGSRSRHRSRRGYGASRAADLPWRFVVPDEVLAAVEPETRDAVRGAARAAAPQPMPRPCIARVDRRPRRLPRAVPHRAGRRGVAQQRRVGAGASGCRRPRRRRALPQRRPP